MKVWILSTGYPDDYDIEAAFSSEEKAQAYRREHSPEPDKFLCFRVHELEVDTGDSGVIGLMVFLYAVLAVELVVALIAVALGC